MESVGGGAAGTVHQCTFNTSSVQSVGGLASTGAGLYRWGRPFDGELGFVSSLTMRGILQVSLPQ